MINTRLEKFKIKYEEEHKRWKVFFINNFSEEEIQNNTIYFVINGEKEENKEKTIDISLYYIGTLGRLGLLEFRKEVKEFLKYIKKNLEDYNFFSVNSEYNIEYSTFNNLGIGEIQVTYNFTRDVEVEEYENYTIMNIVEDNYIFNE